MKDDVRASRSVSSAGGADGLPQTTGQGRVVRWSTRMAMLVMKGLLVLADSF